MPDLEKWLEGLSREQRLTFAELVYPQLKDSADYTQLTTRNQSQLDDVQRHWSVREPQVNVHREVDKSLIGWINPEVYEVAEKQQVEEVYRALTEDDKPKLDMDKLEQSVRLFFEGIGDDPNRDGIKDTPKRVAKVWAETMNGYTLKPEDFVTMFDNDSGYDGPIILRDAEFYTKCEHHLEPFSGTIDIAYWPGEKIIGLSKLLRVARVFAKRPQNQERLTVQVADALDEVLVGNTGVAVRIKAAHHCMISRGVRIKGAVTVTEAQRGVEGWVGVFDD